MHLRRVKHSNHGPFDKKGSSQYRTTGTKRKTPLTRKICRLVVHRFPLSNFKHYLTLFSKFFSTFPRGTCSLSVSRKYLALEGIYLPFRAAIPNNPTLRKHVVRAYQKAIDGDLTLFVALFQET